MRITTLMAGLLSASILAGCGSGYTAPSNPGDPGQGAGGGGGGGAARTVTVGNDFFRSQSNGTTNAAVDTIPAGATLTWTWTNTGNVSHSIQSLGSPIFRNSTILAGAGSTYQVTFKTPGVYLYDCAIHGMAMTGKVVVQ
jgi:Copper binding proteins, plastocyanin/azurin family